MSLNVCVLGPKGKREDFCKSMAKKGSSDDFTFYNTSYQGKVIHLLEPTAYPEKIDAAIDALVLSEFVVFLVDDVNAEFGEQVLLLDALKFPAAKGILVSDVDVSAFTKGTALAEWKTVSLEEAKRLIIEEWTPEQRDGDPIIFVDHSFDVKGVGGVLLGVVKQGRVAVHEKLVANPLGSELEVRSIQKNDVDEKEAFSADRLGIAMKGLTAKEVKRGMVLTKAPLPSTSELAGNITYSKFAAKDSKMMHAFHCLQSTPCKPEGGKLILEKPLALVKGEPLLLCDLNKKMRVVGSLSV